MSKNKFQQQLVDDLKSEKLHYCDASIYTVLLDLIQRNGVDDVVSTLKNICDDFSLSEEFASALINIPLTKLKSNQQINLQVGDNFSFFKTHFNENFGIIANEKQVGIYLNQKQYLTVSTCGRLYITSLDGESIYSIPFSVLQNQLDHYSNHQ